MRTLLPPLLLALLAAPAAALPPDEARHLLARTGFAPAPADIDALAPLDRDGAVAHVLATARVTPATPPPAFVHADPGPRPRGEAQREARRAAWRDQRQALLAWWLNEMIQTPSPLTERMVLFWHGHFTTSARKVKAPTLLYGQNALLRRHALGDFGALLRSVARDPAMLIYLDGARNRRRAPNENFAREVMELFTLGEGHYTEDDVKEAARAFAGWSVDRRTGRFVERPRWRDPGPKTVLGHTGDLDGDDVVDRLLAHPRTAEHVVERLWIHFVSPSPDAAVVRRVAADFRHHRRIDRALGALLRSDAFWDPANRGALVKAPVVLVAGTLRQFDLAPPPPRRLHRLLAAMGQVPFLPPTVKGWPEGAGWIGSATLLARDAALRRFVRRTRLDRWIAALPPAWRRADRVALLLAPRPPLTAPTEGPVDAALIGALLTDPTYQLH